MKRLFSILVVMILVLAMAVPAFAAPADFVDSIAEKPAPGLLDQGDCEEHDEPVYGWILDANGNQIDCLHEGQIIVTPLHQMDEAEEHGILPQEVIDLIWAVYEDLHSGDVELDDIHGLVERIKAELGEYAESHHVSIYELFDVTILDGDKNVVQLPDGHSLLVKFDVKFPLGAFLEVMSYAEDHWQLAESVEIAEDGVYVVFDHLCPVVFLVEAEDVPGSGEAGEGSGAGTGADDADKPSGGAEGSDGEDGSGSGDSPKTGDESNPALWGGLAAAALAGLGILAGRRRKSAK